MLGHVLHLDRVAQVWLVGPVFQRRILVGDQRPVGIDLATAPELLEQPADHGLNRIENILLRDEAHLHVQLIEIGGRAVGTGVLVAETGRDLEVFVEPRHHQKLLELLRCLRQGINLARMQARRHDKVTRALRRRGRDDRRLKFVKTLFPHTVTDRSYHI